MKRRNQEWPLEGSLLIKKGIVAFEPLIEFRIHLNKGTVHLGHGSSQAHIQDHTPLRTPQQVFEEGSDIQAGEIPCSTLDIQGLASSFRVDPHSTDSRNSLLLVKTVQEGRGPFRGFF